MSLEHALLDRLEKRSLQIEQQKNEIYGLRQLVNEKMAINEQLAEQITTARLEREQMQHQISELRTERDRIREISKSLVPKSALKQAVQEAAELYAEDSKLVEENKKLASALEVASSEAKKDRAMYVDEQRRANGLDRQLAAACEDSNRKDREIGALMNEAGDLLTHSFKLGRNNGENVKQFLDRICEGLRKSQAENAPLNKLFVVLCKQRGNLNEEIIYRAVDEASDAIKKLTA